MVRNGRTLKLLFLTSFSRSVLDSLSFLTSVFNQRIKQKQGSANSVFFSGLKWQKLAFFTLFPIFQIDTAKIYTSFVPQELIPCSWMSLAPSIKRGAPFRKNRKILKILVFWPIFRTHQQFFAHNFFLSDSRPQNSLRNWLLTNSTRSTTFVKQKSICYSFCREKLGFAESPLFLRFLW